MSPAPLYTPAFGFACLVHFTGAMSLTMWVLFPLFVRTLGGNELTIGLILGVGLAVSVASRFIVGRLLDRFGRRVVLFWGAALNALSYLTFLPLRSLGPAIFLLAALHLVVGGALFAAYFTYIGDLVPPSRRTEGIATFGVAGMIPNGLGPMLGEIVIVRLGYTGYFLVACGFAVLSLALTLLLREPAPHARGTVISMSVVARTLGRGHVFDILLATVLFGAGMTAAFYFVAPFTRDLAIARAGPFFVTYAFTAAGARLIGREVLDHPRRARLTLLGFALFAAGLLTLCLLPRPGVLLLAGMLAGAGGGLLFPVLQALCVERTPPAIHGVVVSLYTGAIDAGTVLGAPLLGAIAHFAGYRWMFTTAAGVSLMGLGLMLVDIRRVQPASAVRE